MDIETTLGKYSEAGFQPNKHLGMWVKIPEVSLDNYKKNLFGVETDGFHLLDMALILDVPLVVAQSKDWELKIASTMAQLHEYANSFSQKGKIRMTTAKIGFPEKPLIAEFFSVYNDGETDNVIMMAFVQLAKGFLSAKRLKVVPPYQPDLSSSFPPKLLDEVASL